MLGKKRGRGPKSPFLIPPPLCPPPVSASRPEQARAGHSGGLPGLGHLPAESELRVGKPGPAELFQGRRRTERGARWVGCPLGDQSWAVCAPLRHHGGPCWFRLSSSALHTHMDTTVAFPSLNCMMNGWPIRSSGAGLSLGCFRMH